MGQVFKAPLVQVEIEAKTFEITIKNRTASIK
jgi:hypothetical protein